MYCGHRVGGAQAEAGDNGHPRRAIVAAPDRPRGLEPGDVNRVVLLEHGELPEPGHMELPSQGHGPVVILIRNWKKKKVRTAL